MYKKHISWVVVLLVLLFASNVAFAQEQKETKFGMGFQSSFPAWGISGMMDVAPNISVQGILGLFGDLRTYAGRGIYRFTKEPYWNTYGYGMIGAWSYPWLEYDWVAQRWVERTETAMGFGAGAGVEYNWQAWERNLPPIWWNAEVGIGMVEFEEALYEFSTFMIGVGAHYRF